MVNFAGCVFLLAILLLPLLPLLAEPVETQTTVNMAANVAPDLPGILPEEGPPEVQEERVAEEQTRVVLSSGMSTHQVRKRFGDPDQVEKKEGSSLTVWRYGKSVIMFQRRRVSVWIDNGELGLRELVPKRSKQEVSGDEVFRRRGWADAWRRKSQASEKQNVLDELLKDD